MLSNIHAAKRLVRVSHDRCLFVRQEVKVFLCLIRLHSVNMYEHILTAVLDGDELSTSLTGRLPHFNDRWIRVYYRRVNEETTL